MTPKEKYTTSNLDNEKYKDFSVSKEQAMNDYDKCLELIKKANATIITQDEAKQIKSLMVGGFAIEEQRLDDYHSIVWMARQIDNETKGETYWFVIKGKLNYKLNM